MSDLAEYLAGLKAGDVVTIIGEWWIKDATVDRVTPTQIIVNYDRYRRAHRWPHELGRRIGKYSDNVRIATPEDAAEERRIRDRQNEIQEVRGTLRHAAKADLDTIPAMRAALDDLERLLKEDAAND